MLVLDTDPLHSAVKTGNFEDFQKHIKKPGADVNSRDPFGQTAFMKCLALGRKSWLSALLAHRGIQLDQSDILGNTNLSIALRLGALEPLELMIATGLDLVPKTERGRQTLAETNPAPECRPLFDEYIRNAGSTTRKCRRRLGWCTPEASVFALIIFVCDGLLRVKQGDGQARRFFSLAARLPLELQMIIVNRAFGDPGELIPRLEREQGFKSLVRRELSPDHGDKPPHPPFSVRTEENEKENSIH